MESAPPAAVRTLLEPYLSVVRAANGGSNLGVYPGSPSLVRQLLRPQDRLTAIELHPKDAAALKARFVGDYQTRIIELDGWLALGAHLPPKEKRGLVLVDPPFEEPGEFARMVTGLQKAWRRWPGGIFALWYPIKDRQAVNRFRIALKEAGIPKVLDLTLEVRPPSSEPRLDGSGMAVVNPPFTLAGEMKLALPFLARQLGETGARSRVDWLVGEAEAAGD